MAWKMDSALASLWRFATDFWAMTVTHLSVLVPMLVAERLLPAERGQSLGGLLFGLKVWLATNAFVLAALIPLQTAIIVAVRAYVHHGLIKIDLSQGPLVFVGPIIVFFVADGFYYAMHRLQHTIPFLWAQHKLHHSATELNAAWTNHHWLETVVRTAIIVIPMMLLFDIKTTAVVVLSASLNAWAYFKHANLRIELGPLTPVLTGPQLHRMHHSVLSEHADKNFAGFFPIFDLIGGTYLAPRKSEFPPTGLLSGERATTLWGAAIMPFRRPSHCNLEN